MLICGIVDTLQSFFFKVLLLIDGLVYSFVNWAYQIILILAEGNILSNSDVINNLITRIYVIVGVVVLFLVAYSLLKSMVNPDEALKGKESPVKMISNVIISIVLIAVIPQIFSFAMQFQSAILTQNTIGKLILGINTETNNENQNNTIKDGGFTMASTVFRAFFSPNVDRNYCTGDASIDALLESNGKSCTVAEIDDVDYNTWWANIKAKNNFLAIQSASDEVADGSGGIITYRFIFSTAAGVFVLFVLISYCIDIAIRMVKLAVYQLFAPLPILARALPQEQSKKVFSNWLKATISTYLEIFIRLAILYFAVLMINLVITNIGSIFAPIVNNWNDVNPIILLLAQAFVILGIILFVKQAPEIIKEITGLDGGKYGKSLMRGIGMMTASFGGGATAAIRSFANDNDKPIGKRIGRALTAGLGANARGVWKGRKTEKFGDIPKIAGKASSDTLAARKAREEAGGRLKYMALKRDDAVDKAKDWIKGHNAVEDNRTSQAIKDLTSLIDKMQDSWKKDPGYVKNKEAANQAQGLLTAIQEREAELLASGITQAEADGKIKSEFNTTKEEASADYNTKKRILKGTELMLQKSASKSSQIAQSVNQIQGVMSKYSDLELANFSKLSGTYALSGDEETAVGTYKDLSDSTQYNQFLKDLRAGDKKALDYLEALDKLGSNANEVASDINRRSIERKTTEKKDKS